MQKFAEMETKNSKIPDVAEIVRTPVLAKKLGVRVSTVRKWAASGLIPQVEHDGRWPVFSIEDVKSALATDAGRTEFAIELGTIRRLMELRTARRANK